MGFSLCSLLVFSSFIYACFGCTELLGECSIFETKNDTKLSQKIEHETSSVYFEKTSIETLTLNHGLGTFLESLISTYVPSKGLDTECSKDVEKVLKDAKNMQLWALRMLDSSAKLPSGILSGNINQFGDFEQCLNILEPIKGKYCLATFHIPLHGHIDDLIYSYHWSKSNLTDVGHRLPKMSSINWGVCMPASCSAKDLQQELEEKLKGFSAEVHLDDRSCVIRDDREMVSAGKVLAVSFFIILLLCVVFGTMLDQNEANTTSSVAPSFSKRLLISFSLKKNTKEFLDYKKEDTNFHGLDGIRGLNALGLLLCHKIISLFFNPYVNRTNMAEIFIKPWSIIGRTAILYTDSFLLLSGYLSAMNFFKDLQNSNQIKFADRLITRLFRILPNLVGIILFCTYILPDLGNGPQWSPIVGEHSRLCKNNMWQNFLFIHNYMGFENMCLTHTHHLGIDMQLFLLAPIAVISLWRWKLFGSLILVVMAVWSTILRFWVTYKKELSMVVFNGMSVSRCFDSANYSYILPSHRITIYLMGVAMAYIMTKKWSKIYLTKLQVSLGWTIFVSLALLTSLGPMHMAIPTYKYDKLEAAFYAAFSPIVWGSFISWAIWACNNNCAGWFGSFLSWRGFKLFAKISYAVYLTQFPIFFFSVGTQKHSDYFTISKMLNISEFLFVFVASIFLLFLVEIPFNNIHKIIFDKASTNKISDKHKKSDDDNNNNINNNNIKKCPCNNKQYEYY